MESAKYLANVATTANLLFGAISIFLSIMGSYAAAAWIIFFSIIFDIADGKIARMGEGFSEFGKEFDSLADLVSFIVAPAILLFTLKRPHFFLWRLLVCLMVIFCGALRLARFNTEDEEKIAQLFNGLPTTAFGMACASMVLVVYRYDLEIEPRIISMLIGLLAMMMVSPVKYPTYKEVSLWQWKYLLGFAIIIGMLFFIPELTVLTISLVYLIVMPLKTNLIRRA